MNFACEMMDLCRGTQEVEAVISDFLEDGANVRDPLGRLRLAIQFEEKKVKYCLSLMSLLGAYDFDGFLKFYPQHK